MLIIIALCCMCLGKRIWKQNYARNLVSEKDFLSHLSINTYENLKV